MQDNQPGLRPSQEIQKAIQNHGWAGTLEMQTRPGKEEMSWNWNPEQRAYGEALCEADAGDSSRSVGSGP